MVSFCILLLLPPEMAESAALGSDAIMPYTGPAASPAPPAGALTTLPRKAPAMPKPKWHAPWKLFRVISGHLGWVRCVAVEPGNEWFATGMIFLNDLNENRINF